MKRTMSRTRGTKCFACSNYQSNGRISQNCIISFHRIPEGRLHDIWSTAMEEALGKRPTNRSILCSEHFEKAQFIVGKKCKRLKPDAVPTIFNEIKLSTWTTLTDSERVCSLFSQGADYDCINNTADINNSTNIMNSVDSSPFHEPDCDGVEDDGSSCCLETNELLDYESNTGRFTNKPHMESLPARNLQPADPNLIKNHDTSNKHCDVCTAEYRSLTIDRSTVNMRPIADWYCLDCQQKFCKACTKCHRAMKVSCGHQIVKLGEISCELMTGDSQQKDLLCKSHDHDSMNVQCHHETDEMRNAVLRMESEFITTYKRLERKAAELKSELERCQDNMKQQFETFQAKYVESQQLSSHPHTQIGRSHQAEHVKTIRPSFLCTGLTQLYGKIYITCSEEPIIALYDGMSFERLDDLIVRKGKATLGRGNGIAGCATNKCLYVLDLGRQQRIWRVNIDESNIYIWLSDARHVLLDPSVTSDGKVLICGSLPASLLIYSSSAIMLQRVALPSDMRSVTHAVESLYGNYIVSGKSETSDCVIREISVGGQLIRSYSSRAVLWMDRLRADWMTVDGEGKVYFTDIKRGKLCLVDSLLGHCQVLLSKDKNNFIYPKRLFYARAGYHHRDNHVDKNADNHVEKNADNRRRDNDHLIVIHADEESCNEDMNVITVYRITTNDVK